MKIVATARIKSYRLEPCIPTLLQESAEVRISDPDMYQEIVDAEWNIIYDKLEK